MSETYKTFEVGYEVSNLGNVRSIDRIVKQGNKEIKCKGRTLKPAKDKKGYLRIAISINGKIKTLKVHRLVCNAFNNNSNGYPMVNHIDGNKGNNIASNLEWCNNQMNVQHAFDTGLAKPLRLHHHGMCKQTEDSIKEIVRMKSEGYLNKTIAEKFKCSISSVKRLNKNYVVYSN